MSIYTRKGDSGETQLANGRVVLKNNIRVEIYGHIDTLNSYIGLAVAQIKKEKLDGLIKSSQSIQNLLFDLSSEIAGFDEINSSGHGIINSDDVEILERGIDFINSKVAPMKNFILPGGSLSSSFFHLARVSCRELERKMTSVIYLHNNLDEENQIILKGECFKYINRLSDYLFMCARFSNYLNNIPDELWVKR